jgi:hypothetical protein
LRAGAAFLVAFFARFLVDFFFIAITGLLKFVVVCGGTRAPPRLFHYAQKINKPLPRRENSNGKMDFAGRVAAALEPAAQPPRASESAGGVFISVTWRLGSGPCVLRQAQHEGLP